MREFWKGNKWIVIFLGMALAYSICYFAVSDKETILSMLYAVALSYIAAFIFYLLQIFFPERKKAKSVKKIIKSRLVNIIIKVDELYTELFKLYIPNYDNTIDINKHMKNLLKYDFNDYTEIGDVKKFIPITTNRMFIKR